MKARLLIPQLVARGYPLDVWVLISLTHKSPRCLKSATDTATSSLVVHPAFDFVPFFPSGGVELVSRATYISRKRRNRETCWR